MPDGLRLTRPAMMSPEEFHGMLRQVIAKALFIVKARAIINLTGRFLHRRTGRLASSVQTRVEDDGHTIRGVVGTNVFYGKVHEFGMTIVPKPSNPTGLLAFKVEGRLRFARSVRLPARPWLGTAVQESRQDITMMFQREVAARQIAGTVGESERSE